MPALRRLRGLRVVADPAALDVARWSNDDEGDVPVLRVAPDEAIGIRATSVDLADEHAIVVEEHGLVWAWCSIVEIEHHIEWTLPTVRPAFAQGTVAGVPAKLWLVDDEHAYLYTAAAYAHDLADRLGWWA